MIAKRKRTVKCVLEGVIGKIYFRQGEMKREGDKLVGIKKR